MNVLFLDDGKKIIATQFLIGNITFKQNKFFGIILIDFYRNISEAFKVLADCRRTMAFLHSIERNCLNDSNASTVALLRQLKQFITHAIRKSQRLLLLNCCDGC